MFVRNKLNHIYINVCSHISGLIECIYGNLDHILRPDWVCVYDKLEHICQA